MDNNDEDEVCLENVYSIIEETLLKHLSIETDIKKFETKYLNKSFDFVYRYNDDFFSNLLCRIFRVTNSVSKRMDYSFDFKDVNYSNSGLEFDFIPIKGYCIFYEQQDLRNMLECIYDFKSNFRYSKILDAFIPNATFVEMELLEEAKWILGHRNDECCVCYEKNKVITFCGHNLCRVCFYKCKRQCVEIECDICSLDDENISVICPLCKQSLVHL